VPTVKTSRDARGYEHVFLVETARKAGRHSRPRVLYWFRTPPGIRVGREPFDGEARRALERHHPDLRFDWEKLRVVAPPADPEPWRERRRVAKLTRKPADSETTADESPRETTSGEPSASVAGVESADSAVDQGQRASHHKRRRRGGRSGRRGRSGQNPVSSTAGEGPASEGVEAGAADTGRAPGDSTLASGDRELGPGPGAGDQEPV
jgi:hypothetical protein